MSCLPRWPPLAALAGRAARAARAAPALSCALPRPTARRTVFFEFFVLLLLSIAECCRVPGLYLT